MTAASTAMLLPDELQTGEQPDERSKVAAAMTSADLSVGPVPRLAALLALAAEAALVWLLAGGRITAAVFFAAHVAVVILLAAYVRHVAATRGNTTAATVLAIAVGATGPLGALGSLLAFLMRRRRPARAPLLNEWYRRIALSANVDQITRLCDDVASGRHVGLETPPPSSFVAVLERGSLADRQAALGLMARHIHPEYLGALKAALQSSEPVIRVQAAAVATKIRPELRALVDKAVADFEAGKVTAGQALELAGQLEACVGCGLLDASDRIRADIMIPRLKAHGAAADMLTTSGPQETMLLSQGRFRELRVGRRIAAARGPMGRVRRRGVRADRVAANRPPMIETPALMPSGRGGQR